MAAADQCAVTRGGRDHGQDGKRGKGGAGGGEGAALRTSRRRGMGSPLPTSGSAQKGPDWFVMQALCRLTKYGASARLISEISQMQGRLRCIGCTAEEPADPPSYPICVCQSIRYLPQDAFRLPETCH